MDPISKLSIKIPEYKETLLGKRKLSESMARRITIIPFTNNNPLLLKNNLKEYSQDLEKSKNH